MVVGFLFHSIKYGTLKCQLEHCNPIRKPTEGFEERKKYREELKARWIASVADDLDLVTDWWFTYKTYMLHGINVDGGLYPQATLALLISTILGTISYFAELYEMVFKPKNPSKWLSLFTAVFEDAPQIILSMVLSGTFEKETSIFTLDPPAAFNIATSVYSALMKVSDLLFINFCYCCKFEAASEEQDEEYQMTNELRQVQM